MPIRDCHAQPCNVWNEGRSAVLLICIVNGRWRNWTTILKFSTRVCTNILSKTSVCSDTATIFATLATRTRIAEFKEDLSKHLLVKHIATLGPRPQLLDSSEVRFLNIVCYGGLCRRLRKAPERIEIEADPRHAELLIKKSGLQSNSKGVKHTRRAFGETVHAQSNFHHKMPHHTVPMS